VDLAPLLAEPIPGDKGRDFVSCTTSFVSLVIGRLSPDKFETRKNVRGALEHKQLGSLGIHQRLEAAQVNVFFLQHRAQCGTPQMQVTRKGHISLCLEKAYSEDD